MVAAPTSVESPATVATRRIVEWGLIVLVALAVAFLVKTYVAQPYTIPTGSMEPTIQPGDRVLVDKLAYSISDGSVMVFKRPAAAVEGGSYKDLIKRVIGTPGQTLRSGPGGEILVDGKPLRQPWLTAQTRSDPGPAICAPGIEYSHVDCSGGVLHLGPGQYYMMGDNRGDSYDSRFWGPIPGRLFIGKAIVTIWPLGRIHWF